MTIQLRQPGNHTVDKVNHWKVGKCIEDANTEQQAAKKNDKVLLHKIPVPPVIAPCGQLPFPFRPLRARKVDCLRASSFVRLGSRRRPPRDIREPPAVIALT